MVMLGWVVASIAWVRPGWLAREGANRFEPGFNEVRHLLGEEIR